MPRPKSPKRTSRKRRPSKRKSTKRKNRPLSFRGDPDPDPDSLAERKSASRARFVRAGFTASHGTSSAAAKIERIKERDVMMKTRDPSAPYDKDAHRIHRKHTPGDSQILQSIEEVLTAPGTTHYKINDPQPSSLPGTSESADALTDPLIDEALDSLLPHNESESDNLSWYDAMTRDADFMNDLKKALDERATR